jgi:hypothetical protein
MRLRDGCATRRRPHAPPPRPRRPTFATCMPATRTSTHKRPLGCFKEAIATPPPEKLTCASRARRHHLLHCAAHHSPDRTARKQRNNVAVVASSHSSLEGRARPVATPHHGAPILPRALCFARDCSLCTEEAQDATHEQQEGVTCTHGEHRSRTSGSAK